MAKRTVRRPTEDIALARIMNQKGRRGDPTMLQKTIMDEAGVKWCVCCFHTTVGASMAQLWLQWGLEGKGMGFVKFLKYHGIIYASRKAS